MSGRRGIRKCEHNSHFCSQQGVNRYSVNGSGQEGEFFWLCLACTAVLRKRGAKIVSAPADTKPKPAGSRKRPGKPKRSTR